MGEVQLEAQPGYNTSHTKSNIFAPLKSPLVSMEEKERKTDSPKNLCKRRTTVGR
jgi:hypothetical protein